MSLIPRMILLLVACSALLVGVQVPNFTDQYQKRVDAHLQEVQANLAPFQAIADQFHGGSLDALIAHHEASRDPTFRAEADAILHMKQRLMHFQAELANLDQPLPRQVWHLLTAGDRELLGETRDQYSYGIQLDQTAVLSGAGFVFIAVLVLELLFGAARAFIGAEPPRRHTVR